MAETLRQAREATYSEGQVGKKQWYKGVKGHEALCRREFPCGEKHTYESAKGEEALL